MSLNLRPKSGWVGSTTSISSGSSGKLMGVLSESVFVPVDRDLNFAAEGGGLKWHPR
jgi:hypothetical protein